MGQFPKVCNTCGRRYSAKAYVEEASQVGPITRYPLQGSDDQFSAVFRNCKCGSTLMVSTEDLPVAVRESITAWAISEMESRNLTEAEVVGRVLEMLNKRMLADSSGT